MSDDTPAIEVEDVTFTYDQRPVIEDVTLTVQQGEYLGLVGPNGSGKTTLLKLMLGLLRPDAGTVRLFGEPASSFDAGERLGYVSQTAASADPSLPVTVREVVRTGRVAHVGLRRFGETDREVVEQALDRVGITDLADRRIGRLSGGQRQRAYIARALASEADLLALDEPTVGVDIESRTVFYDLLDELHDDGITILLIEHDLGVVAEHVDRVACINRRLYLHDDPGTVAESDALAEAYGARTIAGVR